MRALIATGLFTAALALTAAAEDKKGSPLEGGYTIVSGEEGGKPAPAARIQGSVVIFTADRIVGTDKDKKEFFSAAYALDTSKKPWAIEMTSKEPKAAKASGLVKKEGDTVTIIYALPGGETPTEFKTKEKQQMFVLKPLVKGDKDKPKP